MTVQLMGILNVTPDSFSDGGQFASVEEAVARGIQLRDEGATIVDVGGESTRPGAERVDTDDELQRVIPVIEGLVAADVVVSIDTMNSDTALAALQAGASMINDVSGGLADPGMYRVVSESGALYIAMHWRGPSTDMDDLATYDDVVVDVREELKARLSEMIVSGIDPSRVIFDPGLGFAKTPEHNWQLLGRIEEFVNLGHPLLIGASRKRFLSPWGQEPNERDEATTIITALAAEAGVWGVRVHDVPRSRAALDIQAAWRNGRTT